MLQPTRKAVPAPDARTRILRLGRIEDGAVPVFIREPVLDAILNYSEQDLSRELGGWLLGGVHHDESVAANKGRFFVEIRHFLSATHSRASFASLTFTHNTFAARDRYLQRQLPGEIVVGWQHTHPGFGVQLSGNDLFIQRHYFCAAWHVALVVDPKQQQLALHQWCGDEIRISGFFCVSET